MCIVLWHVTRRIGDAASILRNGFLRKELITIEGTGPVVHFFRDKPPIGPSQLERLRVTFPDMTEAELSQYDASSADYQEYRIPVDLVNRRARVEIDAVWEGGR
jgi:hypothetical protein